MRKIYSIMFAAVAIFTAASCQKEITGAPEVKGEPFYFTASIGAETKTALSDTKSVVWTLGDKVEVFDAKNDPVVFIATKINEDGTALFYSENFNAPENGKINAVYNNPEKEGVAFIHESTIGNLHIGGAHKAVANGFDPRYGILYGQGTLAEDTNSFKVSFTNVHSLIKFTIAGEVPNTITLKCNGARNICGLFAYDFENSKCTQYNPKDGEAFGGEGYIKLTASSGFVSGETYYIPFIAGGNVGNGFSLLFDGKEVINTKETIENIPHNKIFDLGTVQFPEVTEEPEEPENPAVSATKVWSIPTPFNGGVNRNMATDGEYIYVAQAGAPAIKAISLNDTNNIVDLNVEGVKGGLLEMSCVRVLPNNDPNVNGGKPVVIATNLSSSGADLTFYLWKDGIDKAPAKQTIGTGARRLGDKFTVRGSYQSGALWFWDFTRADDAMVRFDINNGILGVTWDGGSTYYASGRWAIPLPEVANSTGEVYAHPDATFENGLVSDLLATTNISDGFFVYNGAKDNKYELSAWTEGKDPELDHTYGYNFFEYKGEKYIAYIKLINGRTNATINIIKDINDAADFKGTLEAKEGLVSIQLLEKDGVVTQNGVGDCVVFTREGNTYVAGMLNNNVISLYKLD